MFSLNQASSFVFVLIEKNLILYTDGLTIHSELKK